MKKKKTAGNTFWHEPFCEALKMELRDYVTAPGRRHPWRRV